MKRLIYKTTTLTAWSRSIYPETNVRVGDHLFVKEETQHTEDGLDDEGGRDEGGGGRAK